MPRDLPLQILSSTAFDALEPQSPWDFSGFQKLLDAVDKKCRVQESAFAGQIACKAGCFHCCRRIPTILPVEWAWLQQNQRASANSIPFAPGQHPEEMSTAQQGALRSELHPDESLCDHLDAAGLCSIYPARPLICRTHGMLLLSDEGIDHCPWNFPSLTEVEEDHVFRLENLHETLLRVNLAFLAGSYPSKWRELALIRIEFQTLK